MKINLNTSLSELPRVGKSYSQKLKRLGLATVRDLLFYFPHRYDDFSKILPIIKTRIGEDCSIQGKIKSIGGLRTFRKRIFLTEAIIEDDSGAIKAVWFNQPYLTSTLRKGLSVSLAGKPIQNDGPVYFSNPTYEIISRRAKSLGLTHTSRLVPVYHETIGLSSRWLRYIIRPLLPLANSIRDFLPPGLIKSRKLLPLARAIREIHFPTNKKSAKAARDRLSFDEVFLIQLRALKTKRQWKSKKAYLIPFNQKLVQNFVENLPFKLTNAQRKAAWEILQDISKNRPMNRLLEGDVGSGKTVVAAIAALEVAKAKFQVAFMAPTEILAKQHFKGITELLKGSGITIGLLTGSESETSKTKAKKVSRSEILQKNREGKIDILIGTHALILGRRGEKDVKFKKLAFVIVDEQHRFGVQQRATLITGGQKETVPTPHLLSMSATPIPRTLALSIYGDLDISLLDEMPLGRKKIITKIVAPANRKKAYNFIREQIKKSRQAFVICPLIEESEKLEVKSANEEYKKLSKKIFPDLKIGLLHGKLKPKEKEKIMKAFRNNKINILVSTSVVEVGIDVPNATVMMIEGSERFGLAQLHQFRGRVGRSSFQSFCFLFTDSSARNTYRRLKAVLSCENGFELAEKDLEIRGPGEFFGRRQSGLPDLAMASLNDTILIRKAREEAIKIIEKDASLKPYPLLAQKLKEFQIQVHFE